MGWCIRGLDFHYEIGCSQRKQHYTPAAQFLACINLNRSIYYHEKSFAIMVGMELLIHSQTSTASPMKLGNEQGISSHFYNGRNCLSLLGFKLIIMSSVKWSPCDILLWWRSHDSSCYCKGFRGCRDLSDCSRLIIPKNTLGKSTPLS